MRSAAGPSRPWAALLALGLLLALAGPGCAPKAPAPAAARETLADKAVAAARSQIGRPYVPGGASPRTGFDCSGLVWWVYGQAGLDLPRRSGEQRAAGRAVSELEMRPGDLVVYRIGKRPDDLHMGVFAGDRVFIHSPATGGRVREESMDDPYWLDRYLGARRVLE